MVGGAASVCTSVWPATLRDGSITSQTQGEAVPRGRGGTLGVQLYLGGCCCTQGSRWGPRVKLYPRVRVGSWGVAVPWGFSCTLGSGLGPGGTAVPWVQGGVLGMQLYPGARVGVLGIQLYPGVRL